MLLRRQTERALRLGMRARGCAVRYAVCALLAAALAGLAAGPTCGAARAERTERTGGFTVASQLTHGAYRVAGAPSVVVHAAPGFDPRAPLQLVVFLHGYNGCAAVLMADGPAPCKPNQPEREGWGLARQHDAAGTNTLFVIPQLAFLQRDGRPGAFGKRGEFRAFLEELLRGPLAQWLGGPRRLRDVASLTLIAHSAGYQTAIAIAERGGVRPWLRSVVLLDALYGETDRYARFLEGPGKGVRFASIYLERGEPRRESERLYRRLRRSLGTSSVRQVQAAQLTQAVTDHPVVFALGRPPHRLLPAHHLTELLRALFAARQP